MKFVLVVLLGLLPVASFAKSTSILDCRAVKVIEKNNPWEEGFSTHEYPEISVIKHSAKNFEVSVGMSRDWETTQGDKIQTILKGDGSIIVRFRYADSDDDYTIRAEENASGKLVAKLYSNETEHLIAIAYCKN